MKNSLTSTQEFSDTTPLAVPEAIAALRLATIDADGTTTLVSLAHQFVLADAKKLAVPRNTPHLDMTGELERQVTEAAGEQYDGSWPGWNAVFAFIERHPALLSPGD